MSQRIRELEKLATETVKCGLNGTSTAESFNRKKFAELIVEECSLVVEQNLYQNIGYNTSRKIREHFGIDKEE
jgi:hypothetical protein